MHFLEKYHTSSNVCHFATLHCKKEKPSKISKGLFFCTEAKGHVHICIPAMQRVDQKI